MKGIPLPEESNKDKEIKIASEAHLIEQQKNREQKQEKLTAWQQECLAFLTDMSRREMTDE